MPTKPILTNPEEVTVLVFKDNDTSRTFQIPLGWITRFGFGLGALGAAALFGCFFALKYYRVAHRADPTHVLDLEQELGQLKAANKSLESKLATNASTGTAAPASASVNPLPVPTVTVTVTPAAAAPSSQQAAPSIGGIPLFSALPRQTRDVSADSAKLPITVSEPRPSWSSSGKTFKVDFNIQYVGTDKGSQQGHIVVLARTPNALVAYPDSVLNRAGTDSLIASQQGEYFSVSRFREVKAEFTQLHAPAQVRDVEILILSLEDQLLYYKRVPVAAVAAAPATKSVKAPPAAPAPAPKAPAAQAAKPAAAPAPKAAANAPAPAPAAKAKPATPDAASSPSDLIEPGVDQ
jgi:hypothetical protein